MLEEMREATYSKTVGGDLQAFGVGLLMQDRDACFQVRRLNIHEQARGEARAHTVLEALELGGRQVGGEHDLLVRAVQRVKKYGKNPRPSVPYRR